MGKGGKRLSHSVKLNAATSVSDPIAAWAVVTSTNNRPCAMTDDSSGQSPRVNHIGQP